MTDEFNHRIFTNCKIERELFYDILKCSSDHRILTIESDSGRGKSRLVNNYKHHCRTSLTPIPVSLVDLSTISSVSQLIWQITDDFESSCRFSKLEEAQKTKNLGNHSKIRDMYSELSNPQNLKRRKNKSSIDQIIGKIDLKNASLDGAKDNLFIGMQHNNYYIMPSLSEYPSQIHRDNSEEIEKLYEELCEAYFIDDLEYRLKRDIRNKSPKVILLDTYEKANEDVRLWLKKKLFPLILRSRARTYKLVIVIAGMVVPDFEADFAPELCQKHIQSITAMSFWNDKDIFDVAEKYGVPKELLSTGLIDRLQKAPASLITSILDNLKSVPL